MKSAPLPVSVCKSSGVVPTRLASATAAQSLVVPVAPTASSVWRAHKIRELAFSGGIPGVTKASW